MTDGPHPYEVPGRAGTVDVLAPGGADGEEVLERSRAVLLVLLERSRREWQMAEE